MKLIILTTLLITIIGCKEQPIYLHEKLGSKQILVVKTIRADSIKGQMMAYEWSDEHQQWLIASKEIPIVVGDKGLAWGRGLHQNSLNRKPYKKEGDKKSPAGIFYLSSLFGYDRVEQLGNIKMPYIWVDSTVFCVDDPKSKYYNRIVNIDSVQKDWRSAERMLMDSIYYKYGVVIDYNYPHTQAGDGSCIFLHIWQNAFCGTYGCTAADERIMKQIFLWLDKSKKPVIIQATEKEYHILKEKYFLP